MQSSGREQNYWPGFVDALSNVVLTLVFIIVIFVFAFAINANKVEQVIQQAEAEQKKVEEEKKSSPDTTALTKENEQLRQELAQAQAALKELQAHTSVDGSAAQSKEVDINVEQGPEGKAQQKLTSIAVSGEKIVIIYPINVADLDDKSVTKLAQVLEGLKSKVNGHKIIIHAIEGAEPYSAAQRYAYYRAITIRNYLISKKVAKASAISSVIAAPTGTGGDRVEIIFGP